ncbi:MAG: PAS domain S-box protein, partial [Bacteroidales bacterium]
MQENKYKHLIQNAPFAYAYHKIILDDKDKPVDYVFIEVNQAFEKMTGLNAKNIINKKVTEVLPGIKDDEFNWIDKYGKIALTGTNIEFEQYSKPLKRWYKVNAYSTEKNYFATVFTDISSIKNAETELIKSKSNYKKLAESTKIILWEFDIINNKWNYVSPQTKDILGYKPSEWKDMEFWVNNLHPNDRDWAVKYCESCTLKGERHRFEYRFRKKDGSYVWLLDDVSVELQKGKPIKLWGSMIDITERKQAEELLQKSEEKYRLIFEFSPLGLFYFDEKGIIKACNNNFINIIGSSQQALVGLDMLKLPDKKIVAALKESLNGNPGF